ncbi:transposase family protein [Streptomyces rubiginosohelvolus]|uniref:helix-turn-helix domain-containing protein n=2 Tax=Streptomyces rubiginosohelvolus TaxID=67362 RepID=UPI00370039F8
MWPLWHERHQARLASKPRRRAMYAGAKHGMGFVDRLPAALAHLRHVVTHDVLACWFGMDRSTVTQPIGEVRPLLAESGCTVSIDVRMQNLAEVVHHLGQAGMTGTFDSTEIRARRPRVLAFQPRKSPGPWRGLLSHGASYATGTTMRIADRMSAPSAPPVGGIWVTPRAPADPFGPAAPMGSVPFARRGRGHPGGRAGAATLPAGAARSQVPPVRKRRRGNRTTGPEKSAASAYLLGEVAWHFSARLQPAAPEGNEFCVIPGGSVSVDLDTQGRAHYLD